MKILRGGIRKNLVQQGGALKFLRLHGGGGGLLFFQLL